MPIKTYKGQLPIGEEEKIHLSTNDGLTGYKIKKFQILGSEPGVANNEYVGKVRIKPDSNIGPVIDFSDSDLLAVAYHSERQDGYDGESVVVFDQETFNQDIFVNITDSAGGTNPCNYYIELEQFKLDLNSSTYHTLKSIRSSTQVGI